MTTTRSRVAATVVMTLMLLTALLASPGSAVPIPQDPGGDSVVPFLGEAREARPIAHARFAPRHPFMAANGRSNLHDDAWQSDAGPVPGPLGRDPEVVSTLFTQECASVTFDRRGRLLTVCVGLETVDLRMLDPDFLVDKALSDFDKGRTFSIPGAQYRTIVALTKAIPSRALQTYQSLGRR